MNILLAAYACEPDNGSEPEVGWQMALHIAMEMKNDDIFVITKKNNQNAIKDNDTPDNLHFYYYELPKWLSFWKRGQRGVRTYYYLWMIGAALYMMKQGISFRIIHHITFVNDWLPSFWMLLRSDNNKFIWGPIGSHDQIAPKFLYNYKRKVIEALRILIQHFFRYCDPFFRLTKNRADCVVGINEQVKHKLKLANSKYFVAEPAIAMKRSFLENIKPKQNNTGKFTLLSVGRLMYIKNFKMTILSFKEFLISNPGAKAELKIIGEGEDKGDLTELVKSLGIEESVKFVGQIPINDVFKEFSKADLFLFPTLENAGFVFLEAMSYSLPIVGLNYGGAQQLIRSNIDSQLVSEKPVYNEIITTLAEKIDGFYHDNNLRIETGKQNYSDLIEHFTWEAKAEKMRTIYQKLLNE